MEKMLDCASGLEHEAPIGSVTRALRNLLEKQSRKASGAARSPTKQKIERICSVAVQLTNKSRRNQRAITDSYTRFGCNCLSNRLPLFYRADSQNVTVGREMRLERRARLADGVCVTARGVIPAARGAVCPFGRTLRRVSSGVAPLPFSGQPPGSARHAAMSDSSGF
ncbi:hypothetical protein VOI32_22280 [Paraburkholderia caribensis]|uniref:Uncharacterized protein n=1 Tax=Paraburkholderia caribensis TaxID=75105 RepID=A0ABV0E252_9BURK|nr:hypothetical protein [Paraburkholderia caribensis]MCO4878621.1 hypothetical protein [Paraburkholderia caribensis]